MLYGVITSVCSEKNIKHTSALCEQNIEFLCIKLLVRKITTRLETNKFSLVKEMYLLFRLIILTFQSIEIVCS